MPATKLTELYFIISNDHSSKYRKASHEQNGTNDADHALSKCIQTWEQRKEKQTPWLCTLAAKKTNNSGL